VNGGPSIEHSISPHISLCKLIVNFTFGLCSDLTEATLAGASISVATALVIALLLTAEFSAFLKTETKTDLIVDRSLHGELLRVNFNMSFPALSCEFATLDISDALGLKRLNLTKTVRKVPIQGETLAKVGRAMVDVARAEPKYDDEGEYGSFPQQFKR
jgi:hypothetical protein